MKDEGWRMNGHNDRRGVILSGNEGEMNRARRRRTHKA